jgi:hypothetical protein
MLEAHTTATLATVGEDGPWAATVFFASDSRQGRSQRQTHVGSFTLAF